MKFIKEFIIDTSNLSSAVTNRKFTVNGDNNAVFSLQVKKSGGTYYDFDSQSFSALTSSTQRLTNIKLVNNTYSGELSFPADTDGETYTILLWAEPHFETQIDPILTSLDTNDNKLEYNPVLYQRSITQKPNATITIAPATSTTSKFATLPSGVETTSTSVSKNTFISDINWTFNPHASAYGLKSARSTIHPVDSDFYTVVSGTVDGDTSSINTVVLDSVDNIVVGMTINGVSSGSLSGTPKITSVNKKTKKITLSSNQSFADGITLTFHASGSTIINNSQGISVSFTDLKLTSTQLTTTVRTAVSNSTTINVNGTYGISKDATIRGVGVNNTSTNKVASVSGSASAGSIVVAVNQTLPIGTKLYIDGYAYIWTITGKINVNSYPESDLTIKLNVDNILTPGTAS